MRLKYLLSILSVIGWTSIEEPLTGALPQSWVTETIWSRVLSELPSPLRRRSNNSSKGDFKSARSSGTKVQNVLSNLSIIRYFLLSVWLNPKIPRQPSVGRNNLFSRLTPVFLLFSISDRVVWEPRRKMFYCGRHIKVGKEQREGFLTCWPRSPQNAAANFNLRYFASSPSHLDAVTLWWLLKFWLSDYLVS